jgi:Protein required for attachment to host cells
MNTKLIIAADRGLLRAYREVREFADRQPHLELIDELRPEAAHEKLSDQVSDQAGRFPRGSGAANIAGDLSAGERLPLETEQSRRLIELLAARINKLLEDDGVSDCSLAASAPIHKQLLEALSPKARGKISQLLASNLAKTEPSELPGHFARAKP